MSLKDEIAFKEEAYKMWQQQGATSNTDNIQFAKQVLHLAINSELTNTQKKYINEYYINGLNTQQIAIKYGIDKSTVSRTINRGLSKLFRVLRYTSPYTLKSLKKSIKIKQTKNRSRGQKSRKRKSGT